MKKLVLALTILLGTHLAMAQTKKPATTKPTAAKPAATANLAASIARGKVVYQKSCIACHQVDGSGVPRLNPPLIKTQYVLGEPNRLIKIILNGLNEDVEIDGEYYSNPMPPQPALNDQEVADVLTYIRNSFTNKAPAITPAQVSTARKTK
ncbi:cytochrome c [Chitinophaga pendula]|uniref:c-type cytochrome n=1 Tax=Chitinophaga TaxID=79328 RepID=UPI000BB03445|nr:MULTISPECIES: cytochrome c [Chitinophaga]ASZ13217.1 cytochrome C [Chitinophaga sp. MD30]UCJ09163.1 cytochrome c [Chitinophaga pendula]